MKIGEYAQKFAADHPTTGEVAPGQKLTAEQARELGGIFHVKVINLSRKMELSLEEASLVDRLVDIGTRAVVITVERQGKGLPVVEEPADRLMRSAHSLMKESGQPWPFDGPARSQEDVLGVMKRLTGGTVSMRQHPSARSSAEDYAMNIMPYFADIVATSGGITLDTYMAGNLQELLADYEMAEAQAA